MLISFHGVDRPDSGELRASLRPTHLEFHASRANLVAGPLLDAAGVMCGSLIVFEAADIADATAQMANDPYIVGGLFETVAINEFVAAMWPA